MARWDAQEALARLGDPAVLRELFDLHALVVDLGERTRPPNSAVAEALRRAPCVTIGVGPAGEGDLLAVALDVIVDEGALQALVKQVHAHPHASHTLVHVLRASEHL